MPGHPNESKVDQGPNSCSWPDERGFKASSMYRLHNDGKILEKDSSFMRLLIALYNTVVWHASINFIPSNLYSTDRECFCAWDFTNNILWPYNFSLHKAHRLASSAVAVWPPRARLDMEHAVPGMVCQAWIKKPCLGSPLCSWSHQLHLHEMLPLWNSQCRLFWRPLLQLKSFNDENLRWNCYRIYGDPTRKLLPNTAAARCSRWQLSPLLPERTSQEVIYKRLGSTRMSYLRGCTTKSYYATQVSSSVPWFSAENPCLLISKTSRPKVHNELFEVCRRSFRPPRFWRSSPTDWGVPVRILEGLRQPNMT